MNIRIEHIFREEMKGDNSFKEKESALSLLFGSNKYSKHDMRDTWDKGIRHGIEIGLRRGSMEGQAEELKHNTEDPRGKEYIEKFYELCKEYNCGIHYHPQYGLKTFKLSNL